MAVSVATRSWTVDDLYRIPDDENRYELLHGELLVTPPAGAEHEIVIARLAALLTGYVSTHGLGLVFSGNPALERQRSFLIPDLMVRQAPATTSNRWVDQPMPILVVEVRSPSTWNRDQTKKRDFYMDVHVPEYWMVDPQHKVVTVVRPGEPDRDVSDVLSWRPSGAAAPLEIQVARIFGGS